MGGLLHGIAGLFVIAGTAPLRGEEEMSNTHIIVIILIVLLVFAVPAWPYNRRWGYYPSSLIGIIVIILLILLLLGRL